MLVSLEEMKNFLRVDSDEENILITKFIVMAEEVCGDILRYEITDLEMIPEIIKLAIMYAVVNMYEKRDGFNVKAVINTMTALLYPYRKESW